MSKFTKRLAQSIADRAAYAAANWPGNVRGFDWTLPPMAGPPAVRTRVGYHRWTWVSDYGDYTTQQDCGRDYYLHPDGSAEVVESHTDFTDVIPPGRWVIEYPTTTFGSRGGVFLRRL